MVLASGKFTITQVHPDSTISNMIYDVKNEGPNSWILKSHNSII
jgi:hypothetical protein